MSGCEEVLPRPKSVATMRGQLQQSTALDPHAGNLATPPPSTPTPPELLNNVNLIQRSLWSDDLRLEAQPEIVVSASRDGRETSPCQVVIQCDTHPSANDGRDFLSC